MARKDTKSGGFFCRFFSIFALHAFCILHNPASDRPCLHMLADLAHRPGFSRMEMGRSYRMDPLLRVYLHPLRAWRQASSVARRGHIRNRHLLANRLFLCHYAVRGPGPRAAPASRPCFVPEEFTGRSTHCRGSHCAAASRRMDPLPS